MKYKAGDIVTVSKVTKGGAGKVQHIGKSFKIHYVNEGAMYPYASIVWGWMFSEEELTREMTWI